MANRLKLAAWVCIFALVCAACGSSAQSALSDEAVAQSEAVSEDGTELSLLEIISDAEQTEDASAAGAETGDSLTDNTVGIATLGDEEGSTEAEPEESNTAAESEDSNADAESEESDTAAEQEVLTLTITATGDCTLGATQTHSYSGSFYEYYDKYGETYFFSGVKDIFEADDFTLVNLECVLTTSTDRVDKTYNLKGYPEYVGILTSSSIEACSLGNNHTMDYGWQSLVDTQDALDGAGIVYGYNDHVGIYTAENGLVIGIVSASLLSQSQTSEDYIRNGIEMLKEQGADLIIACCHWGIEKDYYPSDYQTSTAHEIVDWGADLVIGNHPHVLQGTEYYNGKVICYSLGNFCFGGNKNPSDKDTAIYQQTFTYVDGVLQADVDAKIIPCTVSSVSGYNDFQPTVAKGDAWDRIIGNMNDYSAPYSEIWFDTDGILMLQ